uniref:Uncharacterized protein n=1 Tax=Pseudothermotoga hypogea TaxID=57487 RepID=A0A832I8V9_9THEM
MAVYYEEEEQQELKEWLKAGFTEQSAKLWSELGLSIQETKSFKENFSYAEAVKWVKVGFRNGDIARKWYDAGFSAAEAIVYESLELDPRNANALREYGITAYDLKKGIEEKRIRTDRFNIYEMFDALQNGFNPIRDSEEIARWKELNFTLANAANWRRNGFTPEEAQAWIVEGFTYDQAREWKANEFTPEEAKEWKENGFTPQEAKQWKKEGFKADEAKQWRQRGVTVSEAKSLKEKNSNTSTESFLPEGCQIIIIILVIILLIRFCSSF